MLNCVEDLTEEMVARDDAWELRTPRFNREERGDLECDPADVIGGSAKVVQAIAELARAVTSTQVALVLLESGVAVVFISHRLEEVMMVMVAL